MMQHLKGEAYKEWLNEMDERKKQMYEKSLTGFYTLEEIGNEFGGISKQRVSKLIDEYKKKHGITD